MNIVVGAMDFKRNKTTPSAELFLTRNEHFNHMLLYASPVKVIAFHKYGCM